MSESNGKEPIAVANAPVSYGAFELTVGVEPGVPDGQSVLSQVAAAGYAGIDLGPVGYLGRGDELGEALARHRLGLASAYVELPYSDPVALERALPELDAILDTFDAVRSYLPGPPPRPTLADGRQPGPAQHAAGRRPVRDQPGSGLAPDGWKRFAAGRGRWRSPAAATAATSRPSTRRPAPASRRPGKSSGSSRCRTSGCAWRPGAHAARRRRPGRDAAGPRRPGQPRAPQGRPARRHGRDRRRSRRR